MGDSELLVLMEEVEVASTATSPTIHADCKSEIICRIHSWAIKEEIHRFGWHPEEFGLHQGYMLALSNLLELLQQIDKEIKCS